MVIRNKRNRDHVIDLTGPDGNAFALMGYAKSLAKELNIDPKPILRDMQSGDYDNLVRVFDDAFGEYVVLET